MAKLVLNDLTNTYNVTSINENFTRIEEEFQNKVLYRDNPVGESNVMEDSLDMNSNRILNLLEPLTANEPARLVDVQNAISGVSTANLVTFTPAGTISSTNVQAAIQEVDTEKMAISSLAALSGAGLSGFSESQTYTRETTGRKLKERVSLADKLTTDTPTATQVVTALQAAIDTGAKKVFITSDYTINAGVTLRQNQILDFDGGSLTLEAGTVAANGILYASAKAGVKIVDPVIYGSATAGLGGINLVDCPGGRVVDGLLVKCNVNLQASTALRMGYAVNDTVVNMDGWLATACYVSASNKVKLSGVEAFGGLEGFGVYNAAKHVKYSQCESYSHTQDGFVIIAGTHIDYVGCMAHNNAQSGFTTQRQTASTNTLKVSYEGCHSYSNAFDGFDLRGANAVPFNVDILLTLTNCHAYLNAGTGFYVVCAEGTTLTGCVASGNTLQGFAIQESARTQLIGCRSVSNANGVGAGTPKAGILIQDCSNVQAVGCVSSNAAGATQDYGLSIIGAGALENSIVGGYYQNNSTAPLYLGPSGAAAYVAGAAIQTTGNVWPDSITGNTGAYSETGFGVPAHTRTKGSLFRRTDGAGGEVYVSNGGGSWTGI